MARQRWVYIDGEPIEVSKDYIPEPRSPLVMPDIKPYKSMVTGELITSRSQHREHLKAHKLVEVGNETKHLEPKPKQLPSGRKETIAQLVYERLRY